MGRRASEAAFTNVATQLFAERGRGAGEPPEEQGAGPCRARARRAGECAWRATCPHDRHRAREDQDRAPEPRRRPIASPEVDGMLAFRSFQGGAIRRMSVQRNGAAQLKRGRSQLEKVVVSQCDFIGAASALPRMKRGPRGSFGNSIPKDTLLYSHGGQLVVFTPAKKTLMGMAGAWTICLSIDARRLALICAKLKSKDFLELSYAAGLLVLDDPTFAVPGQVVERPDQGNLEE